MKAGKPALLVLLKALCPLLLIIRVLLIVLAFSKQQLSGVGGKFGEGVLRQPGYAIGVAQKLLTPHLKYL